MSLPIGVKLIKSFADSVCASPNATTLPLALMKDQHWADPVLIQSQELTKDDKEDWDATQVITDAQNLLHATSTIANAALLVMATAMPDSQSVLTLDTAQKEIPPLR